MSEKTKNSVDLADLAQRLDRWRRMHGGPGQRIPEELWLEAAQAAQAGGVDVVGRELRLRRRHLEKRVACLEEGPSKKEHSTEFLELQLPTVGIWAEPEDRRSRSAIVVCLEASDGRRLRLEVPAGTRCNMDALVTAFREATP